MAYCRVYHVVFCVAEKASFHQVSTRFWDSIYATNIWKTTFFLMGKSTISMAIFNSKLLVYQRVIIQRHVVEEDRDPSGHVSNGSW